MIKFNDLILLENNLYIIQSGNFFSINIEEFLLDFFNIKNYKNSKIFSEPSCLNRSSCLTLKKRYLDSVLFKPDLNYKFVVDVSDEVFKKVLVYSLKYF